MDGKKFKWKRNRESSTTKTLNCSREIKIKVKKTKTVGFNEKTIQEILKCQNSFAGCFSADELENIVVKPPCFIMVNLDDRSMTGSHWLAIGCFDKKLEIFDPLGFDLFSWPRIPCALLYFLHTYSFTRQIKISKRLQSSKSRLCGLYCIFYIMFRRFKSFESLQSVFTSKLSLNDSILTKFFYKLNFYFVKMNYEWHYSNKDALDHKITKRYFPRTNNESVLEFIFDKDPNLYLRKNNIRIRGFIEVDNEFIVDTGFVSKLFSMLTVEVNSQTISSNRNR